MTIQRYNQGFGGFGPLEECSTGKLMNADEALMHIERLDTIGSTYRNLYMSNDRILASLRNQARDYLLQRNILGLSVVIILAGSILKALLV
jgi:hypothetical protein